ncbi:MAG TPA: hypothetical protein VG694_01015 [Candidatus Paceibacterota bacterium]|jgi:hypothetical protein|nr:hypothetical protein [Candidatus Paceibacterota bacterium]
MYNNEILSKIRKEINTIFYYNGESNRAFKVHNYDPEKLVIAVSTGVENRGRIYMLQNFLLAHDMNPLIKIKKIDENNLELDVSALYHKMEIELEKSTDLHKDSPEESKNQIITEEVQNYTLPATDISVEESSPEEIQSEMKNDSCDADNQTSEYEVRVNFVNLFVKKISKELLGKGIKVFLQSSLIPVAKQDLVELVFKALEGHSVKLINALKRFEPKLTNGGILISLSLEEIRNALFSPVLL